MTAKRRRRTRPATVIAPAATDIVPAEPVYLPVTADPDEAVESALIEQHPVYGAFGYAFKKIGGRDALAEWAEDNPDKFYAIFSRMVPKEGGGAQQINIQVNANLGPSPLDE